MLANTVRSLSIYFVILIFCLSILVILKYVIGIETRLDERLSTYAPEREAAYPPSIEPGTSHSGAAMHEEEAYNEELRKPLEESDDAEEISVNTETGTYDTERYFSELLQAYQAEFVDQIPPSQNRTDITVRYYPHNGDSAKVRALQKYRLYLHRREAEEVSSESNSLYYGDSVRSSDIQLIAYTLLKNGLRLRQIVPSKYHDSWKARSVEIGADPEANTQSILSLEDIRNFSNSYYPD